MANLKTKFLTTVCQEMKALIQTNIALIQWKLQTIQQTITSKIDA